MAIYLDNQTRPYLERLIKKRIEKNKKDFIAKRFQSALKTDKRRFEKIDNCNHEDKIYIGIKKACPQCGSIKAFEWTTLKLFKNLQKEITQFKDNLISRGSWDSLIPPLLKIEGEQ